MSLWFTRDVIWACRERRAAVRKNQQMPKRISKATFLAESLKLVQKRANGLDAALTMERGLLKDTSRRLHDAQADITAAKSFISRHSIFAEPESLRVGGEPDIARQIYIDIPDELPDYSAMSMANVQQYMTIQREPLHVVLSHIDVDKYRRNVHVNVEFAGAVTVYALSHEAVRNMNASELHHFLMKYAMPDIANDICAKIKRKGR